MLKIALLRLSSMFLLLSEVFFQNSIIRYFSEQVGFIKRFCHNWNLIATRFTTQNCHKSFDLHIKNKFQMHQFFMWQNL